MKRLVRDSKGNYFRHSRAKPWKEPASSERSEKGCDLLPLSLLYSVFQRTYSFSRLQPQPKGRGRFLSRGGTHPSSPAETPYGRTYPLRSGIF